MKLPSIDYGGSVQSTAQTAAAPYNAAAGLSKTLAEGATAYSQAILQSQQTNAALKVSQGLNQAANVLKAKKFLTETEIRDTLGGELPPELEERIKALPKDQIPTWTVGDTLFAHQAKKLVDEASTGINGPGWQTHFRETIAPHVTERQQGLAAHHLEALDKYLQTDALNAVDALVNAGDFDGAKRAAFNPALPAEVQVKVHTQVEKAKQEAPALAATTSNNVGDIQAQIDRLKTDPAAMKAIPEERRTALVATLQTRADKFKSSSYAEEAFNAGVRPGAKMLDEGKILAALDAKVKGESPEVQNDTRALTKARIADFNETRKNETSKVFAYALADFDKPGPLQFKTAGIRTEVAQYLANPANGREAAELWQSLLDKERSAEAGARGLAAQPTEENYAAYASLVKDISDNPGKYRTMTGERFTAEVYGKVGPLISNAMTAYKSVVAPTDDPRVLSSGESRAAKEALPPAYRPGAKLDPGSNEGKIWAYIETRIADRKAVEWRDKKGEVPQDTIKKWVAEEWALGTVKGGKLWGLLDRTNVPKAVAPVAYPDKKWVPNQAPAAGYPLAAPAPAAPAAPAQLPRPKTPAEARALPRGSRFIDPDGIERTVP